MKIEFFLIIAIGFGTMMANMQVIAAFGFIQIISVGRVR